MRRHRHSTLARPARLWSSAGCAAATLMLCGLSGPAFAADSPSSSPSGSGSGSGTVYHGDPAGTGVAASVTRVDTAAPAWTSPALDGQLYASGPGPQAGVTAPASTGSTSRGPPAASSAGGAFPVGIIALVALAVIAAVAVFTRRRPGRD